MQVQNPLLKIIYILQRFLAQKRFSVFRFSLWQLFILKKDINLRTDFSNNKSVAYVYFQVIWQNIMDMGECMYTSKIYNIIYGTIFMASIVVRNLYREFSLHVGPAGHTSTTPLYLRILHFYFCSWTFRRHRKYSKHFKICQTRYMHIWKYIKWNL